jgi:hypothetical protein
MKFQGLMATDKLQYDLLQRFPKYETRPLRCPRDILGGRRRFFYEKLF